MWYVCQTPTEKKTGRGGARWDRTGLDRGTGQDGTGRDGTRRDGFAADRDVDAYVKGRGGTGGVGQDRTGRE